MMPGMVLQSQQLPTSETKFRQYVLDIANCEKYAGRLIQHSGTSFNLTMRTRFDRNQMTISPNNGAMERSTRWGCRSWILTLSEWAHARTVTSMVTTIMQTSRLVKPQTLMRATSACVFGSLAMQPLSSSTVAEMVTMNGTDNNPGTERMAMRVLRATLGLPTGLPRMS